MCFPFLAAQGHSVGSSLCAEEDVELARRLLEAGRGSGSAGAAGGPGLRARVLGEDAEALELDGVDVPDGWMGLDIGPRTAAAYGELIAAAGTVFWNGPMGAFELAPFADGTHAIAEAVAAAPA